MQGAGCVKEEGRINVKVSTNYFFIHLFKFERAEIFKNFATVSFIKCSDSFGLYHHVLTVDTILQVKYYNMDGDIPSIINCFKIGLVKIAFVLLLQN